MAITWGPWAGGSGTNQMRVGIEIDAPSAGGTGTVSYHVESLYPVNDSVNLNKSGNATGTTRFNWNQSGGVRYVESVNVAFAQGNTYNFGASLSDVYNGATPSHSQSVTIAAAPSGPRPPWSPPRWPDLDQVTNSSVRVTSMVPTNDGGAPIFAYQFQAALNDSFTDGLLDTGAVGGTNVAVVAGLQQGRLYYFRTRAVNSQGGGDWSYASSATTLLARPERPSALTLTRNSDTQISLSWNVNYPAGSGNSIGPVWAIAVERIDNVQNAWVRVGTLTGTPSGWTDTGVIANRRYGYRIAAWNKDGQSDWWATGYISMTPEGSWWCRAEREGVSGIRVTWDITRSPQELSAWKVERATNGVWAAFASVDTVLGAASLTIVDNSPVAGATHQYRVRATSLAEPDWLDSPTQSSDPIVATAPPNAPSITGPQGAQNPATSITLTWQHNPVDTSAQTYKSFRWRYQGDTAWTTLPKTAGSTQNWTLAANYWLSNRVVEWQVQTWGQHANPSAWSATGTVVTSTPPTVVITPAPGGVWTAPTRTVQWSYHDADGNPQSGWAATLFNLTNGTREERGGDGTTSLVAMASNLPNGHEFRVDVMVRDSLGMWSATATETFSVEYPEPVAPEVSAVYGADTSAVTITITNPAPEAGEPPTISNEIQRKIEGGEWVTIATGLPPNSAYLDRTNAVAGRNYYRAIATSALPSSATGPEEMLEAPYSHERSSVGSVWISAGEAMETCLHARYEPHVIEEAGRDRVVNRYEERSRGVETSGDALEGFYKVEWSLLPQGRGPVTDPTVDQWRRLAQMRGPHLVRDKTGRYLYGSILGRLVVSREWDGRVRCSLTLEEVEAPL